MINEQMKSLVARGLANNIREVLSNYDYTDCRDYGSQEVWQAVEAEVARWFTADFIDMLNRIQGESK